MSHEHLIIDDDARFRVNPDTKALVDSEPGKRTIVQYDHNSERYTFEIPRTIEGHDMSLCNVVELHFTNIDKKTQEEKDGFFPVTDLHVSAEDDTKVICSCTIDKIATQLVGPLHFSMRYACEKPDGTVDYEYNTRKYTRISVAEGMGNRAAIDVLKAQINNYIEQYGYELVPETYILVDEDGNEVPAVLVAEQVDLSATANDIRQGTTAVTAEGVTTGEKDIPAYHTTEGKIDIPPGEAVEIRMYSDKCEYTKLQALICKFGNSLQDSVATVKVSIDGKVYEVNSSDPIASVTVDTDKQTINLGMHNESDAPLVVRYFTYKEEY